MTTNQFKAWLWPDHYIGKKESRRLRNEYNDLYNSYCEQASALRSIAATLNQPVQHTPVASDIDALRAQVSILRADCGLALKLAHDASKPV